MYPKKKKVTRDGDSRRKLEDMTVSELIGKLDEEISLQVRGNAAIWHFSPYIPCFTCGSRHHWKDMDAGHYIGREWYGTRFDLKNLRPQCTQCNSFHEGQKFIFRQRLVAEGIDVNKLELYAQFVGKHKPARETLIADILAYRAKNKILREQLKKLQPGP